VATHAEKGYARSMTEMGAVGLWLALIFAAVVWLSYARAIRGHFASITAVAIGLGYGFAAILVHSASDFGQHIPADAALTAVTCALLVSLARQRKRRSESVRAPEEFRGSIPSRIATAAIALVACAIALW